MSVEFIGYISNKIDARYLLTFGFVAFGVTSLIFGNVTLEIGPTTLLVPIIVTGFALSLGSALFKKIQRKIGLGAFQALSIDATSWRDAGWAERQGLFAQVVTEVLLTLST